MTTRDYVEKQIRRACVPDSCQQATVKFWGRDDSSHHITLNRENVEAIVDVLTELYLEEPEDVQQ